MDHHSSPGAFGALPPIRPRSRRDRAGRSRPNGIYVIRFRNTLTEPAAEGLHPRLRVPGRRRQRFNYGAPGYGAAYKQAIRQPVGDLYLGGFGETLARFENFVEIDPNGIVDAFGIPVLRIE